MIRSLLVSAALTLSSCLAFAQNTLESPPPSDNRFNGIMFNLAATNEVTITGFDILANEGYLNEPFNIYTRSGSYAGFEASSSGWTLLGTASVTGVSGTIVEVPLALSVEIAEGETQAFYIVSTNGARIGYRNSLEGAVTASDSNIKIIAGVGTGNPFDHLNFYRDFIGRVHYVTGNTKPVAPTPVPTLGAFGLMGLAGVIGAAGVAMTRRRK